MRSQTADQADCGPKGTAVPLLLVQHACHSVAQELCFLLVPVQVQPFQCKKCHNNRSCIVMENTLKPKAGSILHAMSGSAMLSAASQVRPELVQTSGHVKLVLYRRHLGVETCLVLWKRQVQHAYSQTTHLQTTHLRSVHTVT